MSVLLLIAAVIAATELLSWLVDSLEWGRETLPPPNINDILQANYKPEECDEKMRLSCQQLLQTYFKEPIDAPMYQRIDEKMRGLNDEQKRLLLKEITIKASEVMNVELDNIIFTDVSCMGCYSASDNTIMFSNLYIAQDVCNVEIVKTIFHELKHAVQFKAIGRNGNVWGYSMDTLVAWANNYQDYISASWDPEGYMTQPIELDSFGFECSVIPQPGLSSLNVNVA